MKKLKLGFSTIVPFIYIKKNVYRDDKLEEDSKYKARRKTNWKIIQSIKQEGKRSKVWKKKWERNILKNRKLPTKIFL